MQRMPGIIGTVFHHCRKKNMSNKWKPSNLCTHIWTSSLCLPAYTFEAFQAPSQTESCWFPPLGSWGSDLWAVLGKLVPHNTFSSHPESFLRVPKIRRHMLYCETFLALGAHRSYMKSEVCNLFFLGICSFTVLKSCKLRCFSARLLWHSVSLLICIWPRVLLYSTAATCSTELLFCNLQTRSLQTRSTCILPKNQGNLGELKIQSHLSSKVQYSQFASAHTQM